MELPPIKIVCTDRGQHKPRWFGRRPGDYENGAVRAVCPTCRRDVQIGAERFAKIVEAFRGAGMTTLDVSDL